jgi:putative DNA primase/helicase
LPNHTLTETTKFKGLTGGDQQTGEKKFQHDFNFVNFAKLIFACNAVPRSDDDSTAFMRRWVIVNFPNTFEGDKEDVDLFDRLLTPSELSGVLNWALEGLYRLQERKAFTNSMCASEMRDRYIHLSDPVKAFLLEKCVQDSDGVIPKFTLHSEYAAYCRQLKYPMLQVNSFAKRVPCVFNVRPGKKVIGGKSGVPCWLGIRFRTETDTEPGDESESVQTNIEFREDNHD